jgi:uncharacterized protein (DUF58 family)
MNSAAWLGLALFLLLAGVLLHGVTLFLVGLLLLLLAATVMLWGRYCLVGLEYTHNFSVGRAFCGEEIDFGIRLVNRKPMPLAWVAVDDEIPDALELRGVELWPSHKPLRKLLSNLFALSWYEAITRRYRLRCRQRGYFAFGPTTVRSGDVFGFTTRMLELEQEVSLLVYPRVVPLTQLGIPSRQLFGDSTTKQRILEDPLRVSGVREYMAGDSLRRVHWKATARTGKLQVKLLEPTTSRDLLLFLNVSTFDPDWQGVVPGLLEMAIIVAAAIANDALARGEPVGVYANTNLPGSDQLTRIPAGNDPQQLTLILEALAKLSGFTTMPLNRFLEREARALPWTATIVVISAVVNAQLLSTLLHLQRAGRRLALITIGGDGAGVRLPGVPVYPVSEAQPWQEVQALELRSIYG